MPLLWSSICGTHKQLVIARQPLGIGIDGCAAGDVSWWRLRGSHACQAREHDQQPRLHERFSPSRSAGLFIERNTCRTSPFVIRSVYCPRVYAGNDVAPETHRASIAQIFRHFPLSGKAAEDELRRVTADSEPAIFRQHEELRHAVVDRRLAARDVDRAHDERESCGCVGLQDQERMSPIIRKPARQKVRLAVTEFAQYRENPGVEHGKIVQIVAVDALDPLAVVRRPLRITDTDRHWNLD